jgi:hypothetical protein
MAKITITVEDNNAGGAKIVCTPSAAQIKKEVESLGNLTPAYDYAIRMINEALNYSKLSQEEKQAGKIIAPV